MAMLKETYLYPQSGLENASVFHGDEQDLLIKGIGHFTGSHYPREGGKIVLDAHNYKQFSKLEKIKIGNYVTFKLAYGTFTYKVNRT